MRAWWIASLALSAAAGGLVAQQRDSASAPPPATGRLAGQVVTTDAPPQPVRNAIVTVSASELSESKSTMTDDSGRFVFANLPAGRFTITASKVAHITTAYGAKRPGRPGTALPLAAGQQITDLMLRLARGGVITGRVADRAGQPIAMVQVMAIREEFATSSGGALPASNVFATDDRGMYRIYGLDPGTYVVAVVPRVSGLGAIEVMSSAEIDATLARLRARSAVLTTTPQTVPAVAPPFQGYTFSPVYFPGTPAVSDAQRITIAAGDERNGTDVIVEPFRVSTIDGTIATPNGSSPANATLSLAAIGPALPRGAAAQPVLAVRPGPDGRFKYTGVMPGTYVLTARVAASASTPGLIAMETVVAAGDLNITLTLASMPSFRGRVVFAGTTTAPPADVTTVRVQLTTPDAAPISSTAGVSRGGSVAVGSPTSTLTFLKPDGSFELPPISPGTYRLTIQVPGAVPGQGWWPRSAIVSGKDVLDTLVMLAPGVSISDAVVTLSDRHAELAGTLQTPSGQPANDDFIIAFPTDRSLWTGSMRRLQATRPGADGTFSLRDLPAGDYFVAALVDIDEDEWKDAAFLSQVISGAVKVTVVDGQQTMQPLRIGG
jgi:uncharacterized protein (DUF2141 family)